MKQETKAAIDRYANEHVPTGGFLRTVLSNDLFGAFAQSDADNWRDMYEILRYIWNNIPGNSWGSWEAYRTWITGGPIG